MCVANYLSPNNYSTDLLACCTTGCCYTNLPNRLGAPPPLRPTTPLHFLVYNLLCAPPPPPPTMSSPTTTTPQQKSFFTIPPLIKTIFDTFPLITYPAYPAPARCPKPTTRPRLYAWTTPEEARKPGGGYSFDPECLKWQVGGIILTFYFNFWKGSRGEGFATTNRGADLVVLAQGWAMLGGHV